MSRSVEESEAEAARAMPPPKFIPRGRARGFRAAPKRPTPPPPSCGASALNAPSTSKGAAPTQEVSSTSGRPQKGDESSRPFADQLSELNWTKAQIDEWKRTGCSAEKFDEIVERYKKEGGGELRGAKKRGVLCITIEDDDDYDGDVLPLNPTPKDIDRRDVWIEKKQAKGLEKFYSNDGAGFMICRRPNDSVLAVASTSDSSEAEEDVEIGDIDGTADEDADTIVDASEESNEANANGGNDDEDATTSYGYPEDGTVVKFEGKREGGLTINPVEMEEDEGDMVFVRLDPDDASIGINLKSWEAARISDLIYAFSYEQQRRARDVWGRRFASHVGRADEWSQRMWSLDELAVRPHPLVEINARIPHPADNESRRVRPRWMEKLSEDSLLGDSLPEGVKKEGENHDGYWREEDYFADYRKKAFPELKDEGDSD